MAEKPCDNAAADGGFRCPMPVDTPMSMRYDGFRMPENRNQNNASSYDSYSHNGSQGSGESSIPVQQSNSWPVGPGGSDVDGKGQPRNNQNMSRSATQNNSSYGPYSSYGSEGSIPLHHMSSRPISSTPGTPTPYSWSNQYNSSQSYGGMYYSPAGYYNYDSYGAYSANAANQQSPVSGDTGYSANPYNQWNWGGAFGRRFPAQRTGQSSGYAYQSASAPPSASNSINDVGTPGSSATYLTHGSVQDDGNDDFTLNYPHVMEQNKEPFEYQMDKSQRPESLQDAISMYIDYLIAENEHKTRISHALPMMNITSPITNESYYRAMLGKPIPFPTEKFLKWLKLFNLDIEITDLEGNTTPQTLFEPSESMQNAGMQAMETTHVMNWETSRVINHSSPGTGGSQTAQHNDKAEAQILQTASGTKVSVCQSEPDSTSSESLGALKTGTSSVGCNDSNSPTGLVESNPRSDQGKEEKRDILQNLMGKSASDIFKDSPACKTMMSLCELVGNDDVDADADKAASEINQNDEAGQTTTKENNKSSKGNSKKPKQTKSASSAIDETDDKSYDTAIDLDKSDAKPKASPRYPKRGRGLSSSQESASSKDDEPPTKRVTRSGK